VSNVCYGKNPQLIEAGRRMSFRHSQGPVDAIEACEPDHGVGTGSLGISAIAVCEPPWVLENEWFGDSLPRKFVQHTGIRSRRISQIDEIAMAVRAVEALQREVDCDLEDCAALVFVSPSVVPAAVAAKLTGTPQACAERLGAMARDCAQRLGLSANCVVGINWFCSGYTKALSLVQHRILSRLALQPDQFVMVITASRISRITDYGCPITAPLFGDMATVTVLARIDSQKYPVHLALLAACAETRPADKVLFDFHCRQNVMIPAPNGSFSYDPRRLVFSLDGMGIGDAAPRAMADATCAILRESSIRPEDVRYVVPHQAGNGIVRLASMKFDEIGVHGEVVNGLTIEAGNVSSSSIPFALRTAWWTLDGTIACPSAGVGAPGQAKITQGCILLQATHLHTTAKHACSKTERVAIAGR
jgi:3-oxoacyl-[acyl-carrier-protein] synthase III